MTVDELRQKLNDPKLNPNALVVLSRDGEGNGFQPVEAFEGSEADYRYFDGDLLDGEHSSDGLECVVLWPMS